MSRENRYNMISLEEVGIGDFQMAKFISAYNYESFFSYGDALLCERLGKPRIYPTATAKCCLIYSFCVVRLSSFFTNAHC